MDIYIVCCVLFGDSDHFSWFCSYVLKSSSMVMASALQFSLKAVIKDMEEVRQPHVIHTFKSHNYLYDSSLSLCD